jgi:hypothetical protein
MLASMLVSSIEKKTIRALGRVPKDFGKNKIKYQIVPTTSRRMLRENRCVKKYKGMLRSMLRDVEFFFLNVFISFSSKSRC